MRQTNPLALTSPGFWGDIQGQTSASTSLGTTFEQPMAYPQKQMTIESCSYPARYFKGV
jgi:hypothetical protein